jgi:integrase
LAESELAASTGLRMGSMYALTCEMVDWDGRMLTIPTNKNGEALHIPLNNTAMAALTKRYGHPGSNRRHEVAASLDSNGTPVAPGKKQKRRFPQVSSIE